MNRPHVLNKTTHVSARGLRFAIVVSRFHEHITRKLLDATKECLQQHGVADDDVQVFYCPGSFELPQVADRLVHVRQWDGIICLGVVIRGETPHFKYVSSEAARGIQEVALRSSVPVIFGVLTTDNEQQALERAGGKYGNKGWDAALAAIEMVRLFKNLNRGLKGVRKHRAGAT